jgi:hypothetical protein
MSVRFEYDPAKREANLEKHGFDFADAAALWADVDALEAQARSESDLRKALIARHGGKLWTAIFTERGPDTVRLISVRRSRDNEKARYER